MTELSISEMQEVSGGEPPRSIVYIELPNGVRPDFEMFGWTPEELVFDQRATGGA
ncbi:bacteriocin [uncultured Umboniibacter sp.]|uniref:bacteriocin n=1 Tax=uncultured Umboniibacter sp. TaxID=1798917 RepID=UPI002626DEDF|nr:bacteriocin [uncultured Umboniibacter sp.]